MGIGARDFILVFGNQGCGKSVWTQLYCQSKPRLIIGFDPKAEYPGVDYATDPKEWVPRVVNGELEKFRFGSYLEAELETLGNAAYAAGRCCLVMEECALLFDRGADLAEWTRPLIFMGREPQLDLVLIAQRANRIPVDIRSQSNRIITFNQTEPDDVKALAQRIGKEHAEEILMLPPLHCLDWQQGVGVKRYAVHP